MPRPGDISPLGINPDGDAFELNRSRQVPINVAGKYLSATNAAVELTLIPVSPPAPPLVVARTDLNSPVGGNFVTCASLRLGPGKYQWTCAAKAAPGGSLVGADITSKDHTPLDDALGGSPGRSSVYGSNNGFVLVRGRDNWPIYATVDVHGALPAGGRVGVKLVIIDVAAGTGIESPEAVVLGPANPPLRVEAAPYYLKAGRLFKFTYYLNFSGTANLSCSVSVNG